MHNLIKYHWRKINKHIIQILCFVLSYLNILTCPCSRMTICPIMWLNRVRMCPFWLNKMRCLRREWKIWVFWLREWRELRICIRNPGTTLPRLSCCIISGNSWNPYNIFRNSSKLSYISKTLKVCNSLWMPLGAHTRQWATMKVIYHIYAEAI